MAKSLEPDKLYSLEAEAGVLGSMLLDPESIPKVLPKLPRSEAFFRGEHRVVYDALIKLYIAGIPIDAVSLRTELKQQNKLKQIGGVKYIKQILESVPHAANVLYYVEVVRSMEKERKVRSVITDIVAVPGEPWTVDEKIQNIQELALGLEPLATGPDFVEMGSQAVVVASDMGTVKNNVLSTGFWDIDKLIHGFYPGEVIILAGRPSMGKSSLMLDFALNMAKVDIGGLIFSLEMNERMLVERAICNLACVDSTRVRDGNVTSDETNELYTQASELQKLNIIISKVGQTPEQIGGLVHRLRQTHNIGIAFLDYLQLMTAGRKSESRQQEITTISRKLKGIALREDIPLVVLSQLNRQPDVRENHRPRMSDLRESGSIEQDADLVMFVYREDYYRKDESGFEPTGLAEVIISKNRRGPVGKANLVFVHDYTKFSNLPPDYVGVDRYV